MVAGTDPAARANWRARADTIWRTLLRPPPRMALSEWADRYRILTPEASAEPGPWRTDRAPYLRGIMDTISDPLVRRVCWVAASQVGKTETINNFIGYTIHLDPGPMLIVNYSLEVAQAWSKDRFAPMIRAMPELRERVGDPRSRDSDNTILHKVFPGGHITAVGANSAAGLSSRPIRYALFDEEDRYPASAGAEGDPVGLGEQRTRTFVWSKKIIEISSPLLDQVDGEPDDPDAARASRIQKSWVRSDQRFYFVPCLHCEHMQTLFRPGEQWSERIIWETEQVDGKTVHHTETAALRCEHCACLIDERDKLDMLMNGEWRPTKPSGRYPGFHLSSLYSPWVTWAELAQEFLEKKNDRFLLQGFVNQQLADWWRETPSSVKPDQLGARAESWPAEVPHGVGILTAGVDVQDDRLEVKIKGWGAGEESWLITHRRVYGDPREDDTWSRLDHWLVREYEHESGAKMRIQSAVIDSGHLKDEVYKFAKPRQLRGVHVVKGVDTRAAEPLKRAQRKNRGGVFLWSIGTYEFKDIVFARLKLTADRALEQGAQPGFMHFCTPTETGADAEYFAQFGAEVKIQKKVGGRLVRFYKQVRRRNEAIDLEVYATAALHILGRGVRNRLGELAEAVSQGNPAQVRRARKRRVRHRGVE